jgi:hypothetical protein
MNLLAIMVATIGILSIAILSLLMIKIVKRPAVWSIGIFHGNNVFETKPVKGVNPIIDRNGIGNATFVADPFIINEADKYYCFYEIGKSTDKYAKGEIGFSESRDGINYEKHSIIISGETSLSFPIIYNFNDEYYMTLNSYYEQEVRLYIAKEFPSKWELLKVLVKGYHSDPSLLRTEEGFFLITSNGNDAYLFYSANLEEEFREHPNHHFVRNDAKYARNAGKIFCFQDDLYRPVQDCSKFYGEKVRLMIIKECTPQKYFEVESERSPVLFPGKEKWCRKKMHTFNLYHQEEDQVYIVADGAAEKNTYKIIRKRIGR